MQLAKKEYVRSPTNGELLVKNLRLLDLDEEFDGPNVQSRTFAEVSTVDKRPSRTKAAYWILYKLFEAWNPGITHKAGTRCIVKALKFTLTTFVFRLCGHAGLLQMQNR